MKWKNLQESRCPSCDMNLVQKEIGLIGCSFCSFHISEKRLDEIIRFGYREKPLTVEGEQERLSELNNLGRKPFDPYKF